MFPFATCILIGIVRYLNEYHFRILCGRNQVEMGIWEVLTTCIVMVVWSMLGCLIRGWNDA